MFIQDKNFGHDVKIKCGHVVNWHNSGNHLHQYCEIEMVTDGEIEITVSGKKYIAKKGDIALIPPFKVHSFHTPERVEMLIMTLPNFFLPATVGFDELSAERDAYVFTASEPLWHYLYETGFHTTRTKHFFKLPEDRALIHRLQAAIHLIIAEFLSVTEESEVSVSENTLARILLYVSNHFTEDITLGKVGEALGYNPKYVSACFSMIDGISFRDFLNSLRIERAKALLITTDSTVLTIALECGFKNESTFHRVFLDATGTTPAKYRKSRS
ncbi:MAG: AraC family transcriptional regulator [Clostridia bacterium]|nr:AraC family transcriptional regulator [Clostridia bacterium]